MLLCKGCAEFCYDGSYEEIAEKTILYLISIVDQKFKISSDL